MTAALLGFAAASTLIVMLPGPDTLVVVRNLLRGGRARASRAALGVLAGLVVWVAAAALGLSAVVQASHTAYDVLRYVGGAYLIWIGVMSLRARIGAHDEADVVVRSRYGPLLGSGFLAGMATDLLNPKVGVFFVTFLPAFVPHHRHVGAMTLLLGGIFILETFVYFAVLIRAGDRIVQWMRDPRMRLRMDRAAGLVFIGFGLRLATDSA